MSARSKARAQYRSQGRGPQHVAPPRPPVLLAERRKGSGGKSATSASRAFSLAWDQNEALGITPDMRRSGPGMLSDQERKEVLYKAYLNNVWISACVDVIAKRITSGGFVIEEVEQDKGNKANRETLASLLSFVNEDDDFLQLVRAIITDLLIYGEAYMEIVKKGGKPFSLHKIDCITMNYVLDQHGHVVKYIQNMTHNTDTVEFQPEDVIRWWLPDAQAHQKALSPIERILGPVDADTRMADWTRQFFRKGAKPSFWIDFPGPRAEAERFIAYFRENYTGQANAHVPPVMYQGAKIMPFGQASLDADFIKGRELSRQEILAGYQVPPAIVSQIESGNIGGGTGESQDKSFQFNACDPIKQLFFEKFNYRVVQQGFAITDWRISTRYGDYRSDDMVAKIHDLGIRNGSKTVNEIREETGKPPLNGGDEAVIVASRDILPVQRLADLADEQRQQTSIQLEQAEATADLAKTKADQAKAPPEPAAQALTPPANPSSVQPIPAGVGDSAQESANHSGIMVAFMLEDSVAQRLAIPGGEPASDMHVTLAYLGNAADWTPAEQQGMQRVVSAFASSHPALAGRLSGVGRFNAPQGQPEPVYASVDVPDLPAFRQALIHALSDAGFDANQEHGFTPHCTLAYLNSDEPTPVQRLGATPLLFDRLLLAIGGQQHIFLLSGTKQEERRTRHWSGPLGALPRGLYEEDASPVLVSQKGSCDCDVCRGHDGKVVDKLPPYHEGCSCEAKPIAAQESSDPKAPAASGSRPGGLLVASRKS